MPRAQVNGIELEYETFGDPEHPTLLLIMGLGAQMIAWDERLCRRLAVEGFHVVRYDNRDSGLSTFLDTVPQPDLGAIFGGDPSSAPYLLSDLADDALALLGVLGVDRAHVVGASMGGMIAQQLVIDHPERVLSLCSIMSRPGDPTTGQPSPEAAAVLMRPRAIDRATAIESNVQASRTIGSPDYPRDEEELRAYVARAYDRSSRSDGFARQLAAIVASPDRTPGLAEVVAPTLVIHGEADRLVDVSGGRATAAAVPKAELLTLEGMGHDLPAALWPRIVPAIAANARAGEALQAG
ncbi:alpha/beta fold hydrolase [Streptacidiphilus jiangxiensis]|uniref:Pimeloyl-ACP methyl ester carboxylesterase n=1 Tax=Streptacidiphilus jiangxiensis TaxID=235985 RepID=A0A1H7PWJ1_STRJI|nr:alpha/beta hydrolase [Streptacidiphilus jiangxiensis]SEL39754.1 Pimeloyl-ACP methyl ester carboxylesterase [Streptacidiphilus jiangxiensis]